MTKVFISLPAFKHSNTSFTMTEWRVISGSEFLVSSAGEIMHRERQKRRVFTEINKHHRYPSLSIKRYGRNIFLPVHKIVAEAFLGPRPNGMITRHLDGNAKNNRIENIAYGTPLENQEDRERHGTVSRGEMNSSVKVSDLDVEMIRLRYANGGITQRELARDFGITQAQIHHIIRYKSRQVPTGPIMSRISGAYPK